MLVLAIGASDPQYALARIVETILGAAVGVIVNVAIVPPVLTAPARQSVLALGNEIAVDAGPARRRAHGRCHTRAELDALLIEARLLRPMEAKAQTALTAADDSLSLNPRQRKHRAYLAHDQQLFDSLRPLINRTLGMTRAYHDHYDDSLAAEPTIHAIADELHRAAHDLRLLTRDPDEPVVEPGTETAGVPVLTAPLTVATPDPRHWVLIGSLVEDLRRIHVEIAGRRRLDGLSGHGPGCARRSARRPPRRCGSVRRSPVRRSHSSTSPSAAPRPTTSTIFGTPISSASPNFTPGDTLGRSS